LAAGRLDVDGLLAELSAAQLREWEAFDLLEPFGNEWRQTALLAMLTAETNRDAEKKPEPFTVEDFLPSAPEEDEPEEDEPVEQWQVWKQMFALMAAE
jgi:hypothetical protein